MVGTHNHRLLLERRERSVPLEVPRLPPHEQPLCGFIFFCNDETMPEDFQRRLFGLPRSFIDSVRGIRKGLPLFLYNYSNRCLHGVFEASSDGGLNIEPDAWISKDGRSGLDVSRYPAQVRVRFRENRAPLEEDAFRPVLFHYEPKKFRLELSNAETAALLKLFSNQRLESSNGSDWETVRGKPQINWPKPGPTSSPRKVAGTGVSRADLSQAWRSSSNGEILAVDSVGGDQIREEVDACTNKMVGVLASESDSGEDGLKCSSSRGSYIAALKSGMQPSCCSAQESVAAAKSNGGGRSFKMDNKQGGHDPAAIMGRLHDPDPAVNSEEQQIAGNGFTNAKSPHQSEAPKEAKPWKQRDDDSSHNKKKKLPLIQLHPFTSLPQVPLLTPIRFPVYAPPPVSDMDGFCYQPVQRESYGAAWSLPVMVVPPAALSLPLPAVAANVVSNFGVLHAEILEFARTARPSPSARARAEAAVDCVRQGVKQLWPGADVEVFGSFATGLCLPHSDVDVVVVDAPAAPALADGSGARGFLPLIRSLAAEFKDRHRWCKSLMTIETASMPVIKLCCDPFPDVASDAPLVAIDVTLGGKSSPLSRGGSRSNGSSSRSTSKNRPASIGPAIVHNGAAAREYVLDKLRQLPALAPLVLLMKSFLHCKGLNDVYNGGLGSFSLTLMLVFYLEQVPVSWNGGKQNGVSTQPGVANHHSHHPVPSAASSQSEISDSEDDETNLTDSTSTTASEDGASRPPSEELISRAWRIVDDLLVSLQAPGAPNLGSLLIGFLHIFGQEFDFSRAKIVLKGSNGSSGGMFALEPSFQPTSLWIDDPLKPGMNVGAGSFAMGSVQAAMRDMLFVLAKPQQEDQQHKDQNKHYNHHQHHQQERRNSSLPHLDQLFQVA